MQTAVLLVAALVMAWALTAEGAEASGMDLATVRERLLESRVRMSETARAGLIARAEGALGSMREDGSWADQDYADTNRERWKCGEHLPWVVAIATAARQPGVSDEKRKAYVAAAVKGLGHWLRVDPKNTNWWHNEIGVPMNVGDILILLGEDAPVEVREKGMGLMRRAKWEKWTGQNLVWGTKIQIVRSCIAGGEEGLKSAAEAFARMYEEIRITPGREDGIKRDWSFFQHGPVLYSGGYGAGFSADASALAVLGMGTGFAIPAEKLDMLVSYMLEGQAWMVRGKYWDYSVTGREIVRKGKNAASLAGAAENLAKLMAGDPVRQAKLNEVAARIRGKAGALSGNQMYWCADYMVHSRPDWFASVRMYSTRTTNTDGFINGENKQSHHLADGVTYILLNGDEYEDIFPVWDWHKTPGSTVEQGTELDPKKVNHGGTEKFVGGVSDGGFGCTTMDLTTGDLQAKKSWFFFGEGFVALGTGITCPTGNAVVTTVNQCLLKGEVKSTNGLMAKGEHAVAEGEWVWHAGVGYVPLMGAAKLRNDVQEGNWFAISPGSKETVRKDVFALTIDHGTRPAEAGYAYLVLPGSSAEETAAAAMHLPIRVLANTPDLQAVYHEKQEITQAIFRKAGSVAAGPFGISVDRACAVMVSVDRGQVEVSVADPAQEATEVVVTVGAEVGFMGGEKLADGGTRARVHLPQGMDAGRSRRVSGQLLR